VTLVGTAGPVTSSSVTLRGPAGVTGAGPVLGTATSAQVGAPAVLQAVTAPATGLYTATVSSPPGPAGLTFTLKATLNAAQEAEANGGPTNNTPATAQNLSAAFTPPTTASGSPDRAAVTGLFTGSVDHYAFSLVAGQSASVAFTQANPNDRLFNAATVVA